MSVLPARLCVSVDAAYCHRCSAFGVSIGRTGDAVSTTKRLSDRGAVQGVDSAGSNEVANHVLAHLGGANFSLEGALSWAVLSTYA